MTKSISFDCENNHNHNNNESNSISAENKNQDNTPVLCHENFHVENKIQPSSTSFYSSSPVNNKSTQKQESKKPIQFVESPIRNNNSSNNIFKFTNLPEQVTSNSFSRSQNVKDDIKIQSSENDLVSVLNNGMIVLNTTLNLKLFT